MQREGDEEYGYRRRARADARIVESGDGSEEEGSALPCLPSPSPSRVEAVLLCTSRMGLANGYECPSGGSFCRDGGTCVVRELLRSWLSRLHNATWPIHNARLLGWASSNDGMQLFLSFLFFSCNRLVLFLF